MFISKGKFLSYIPSMLYFIFIKHFKELGIPAITIIIGIYLMIFGIYKLFL